MTKKCFKCLSFKPTTEFYRHPQMSDGFLGKCKDCTKSDVKKNYAGRRAKYSKYEKSRNKTQARKEKKLEYMRARRAENPKKYKANCAVNNAVRDGRMIRLPCEVCGNPKSEGHHDDYDKPLEVRWLCFKHHRELKHGQTVTNAQ